MVDATTGFVNKDGAVQYGADNTSSGWDYVTLSRPNKAWRIIIDGDIPAGSDRPDMSVSIYEGTIPLLDAVGTWQVQGQSSANADKKNWKLKLKNPVTGNKLSIKVGDWDPVTSITLKAYATDRTLVRDIVTTRLWRDMYSCPSGKLAPDSAYSYFDSKDTGMHTSAYFSTDGVPVEVFHNSSFMGMYIFRTGTDEDMFLMDTANPKHILVQPQHAHDFWSDGSFQDNEWEFTSPATVDDTARNACKRFMTWASDCVNGKQDITRTYMDYIDLRSFIDYILLCEISASYDSMLNNFFLASWNATPTSGRWFMYAYDQDETFGIGRLSNFPTVTASQINWVTIAKDGYADQSTVFFELIHKYFKPQIRNRWRELRDAKRIDKEAFVESVKSYTDYINPSMLAQDLQLWSLAGQTGLGTGTLVSVNGTRFSVSYIQDFFNQRIDWLDEQFKYYG